MYHHIIGKLFMKKPTEVVLDAGGIGYILRIPLSSYEKLPLVNETAELYTHLYVREDQLTLYGFATETERELFRMLIGVNGVGPVAALAILSGVRPGELVRCVRENDVSILKRTKGIGPKTAQRIIIDLAGKVESLQVEGAEYLGDQAASDAVLALISLGLARTDAEKAVLKAVKSCTDSLPSDELVKIALKYA